MMVVSRSFQRVSSVSILMTGLNFNRQKILSLFVVKVFAFLNFNKSEPFFKGFVTKILPVGK